jgi:prophage antirepressor-like protein
MNALINLTKCREYMTINIGGQNHQIKLSGTIENPYFCGRDVCNVLGYEAPLKALQRYVEDEDKNILSNLMVTSNHTLGKEKFSFREGQNIFISETGLYSLILSSQAPFAKEFKKLVCKVILPSIRKYGSYQVESQLAEAVARLAIRDKSEEELQKQLEQERQRAEKTEKEAEEQRQYALILKDLAVNDQKRPLNEAIYISTSKAYAANNRHKVGGVEGMDKLKSRFAGYNGRSSVDDMWYYSDIFRVANFRAAEKRIEDVLGRFRERKNKEMYVLHYDDLRRYVEWICKHYEDEINKFNEELDVLICDLNRYNKKPVIPKPYQGTSPLFEISGKGGTHGQMLIFTLMVNLTIISISGF